MAHLGQNPGLLDQVNQALREEGLHYAGQAQVKHLLQVLDQDVGVEALRRQISRPYRNLKVAAMYGCHALRPSRVTKFDDPYAPTLIDRLVQVTGADSVSWEGRLSCCGAPVRHTNDQISLAMITSRLRESRLGRADVLLVNCPYSQMQADWAYETTAKVDQEEMVAGTVLFPQLLGLTMGLSPQELSLELSKSNALFLVEFLPPAGIAG
jgi:heterodisulfide reductase subunit B